MRMYRVLLSVKTPFIPVQKLSPSAVFDCRNRYAPQPSFADDMVLGDLLIAQDKRGYSAAMLSRELDLPYNTAWFLLHRIRTAMSQRDSQYRLSGIVELDDTYFGKPSKGHKRGRGTAKTKVIVAVSKTTDEKPLKVKMQVVPNLKGTTTGKFAKANIDEQSTIQTDAYHSYRKPLAQKYFHQYEVFSPDSEMLKWLHILIGNAKAFVG